METKKKLTPFGGVLAKKGKYILLAALALLGVLLLLFGGGKEETATASGAHTTLAELESYRTALENEIKTLCDAVSGVGSVEVMVTLSHGSRAVYATDKNGQPVTVGSGSAKQPLLESIQPPAISGVGIVCRGGDNPAVQQQLIELLSTTLGISAARVFVAGK